MITGCRKFDNLFVSRGGEGRRGGWVRASDIWSRAKIGRDLTHCCFPKTRTFLASIFIFASVYSLSSLLRDSFDFYDFRMLLLSQLQGMVLSSTTCFKVIGERESETEREGLISQD